MDKFIGFRCEHFYRQYKNLIWAIFFLIVKDISFGSHNVEYFIELKAPFMDTGNLSQSYFIHQMFCFIATSLLACLWSKREANEERHDSEDLEVLDLNLSNQTDESQVNEIELIHNETKEVRPYPLKYLLLIIIIWVIDEEILNIFDNIFIHLDFWMFELFILTKFMEYMLKLKTYKHQNLMLILTIIPGILKFVTIILCFRDKYNKELDDKDQDDYRYGNIEDYNKFDKLQILYVRHLWLIALGPIIYFGLICARSYINTKIKWLIDIKYESIYKILIIYGLVGAAFCFLVSFIATFINCGEWNDSNTKRDIGDYFCKVHYNNKKYFESFASYFSFSEEKEKIGIEALSMIIGIAAFFGYKYNIMKIIEILTPAHIIFAFPFYYLLNKSYLFIFNIKNNNLLINDIVYAKLKISLDYASDFVSFLGFLVYLEIIELRFCGLDYNLKRKINDRALIDTIKADPNRSYYSESDSGSTKNKSFSSLNDSDM